MIAIILAFALNTFLYFALWLGLPFMLGRFLSRRKFPWAWLTAGVILGLLSGPFMHWEYGIGLIIGYIHMMPAALIVGLLGAAGSSLLTATVGMVWAFIYGLMGLCADLAFSSQTPQALEDADEAVGG